MSNINNDTYLGFCPYCRERRMLYLRPYDSEFLIMEHLYLCKECLEEEMRWKYGN